MEIISKHPFAPLIPVGATKLIIGTIPPPRFCKEGYKLLEGDVNYYYGSRDNLFWPLLGEIFNTSFNYVNNGEAIAERKKILEKFNIGITDIIANCIHEKDSALDKNLKEIVLKDIDSLLINFPTIDTLIYTSEFVKKLINNHFKTYHSLDPLNSKHQNVKINGKLFTVYILYSPSPLALINMGENGAEKRKEQYRQVLTSR